MFSLLTPSDAVSVKEGSSGENENQISHLDDGGWTLVTRRKGRKIASCCTVDEKEAKNVPSSCPSSEDSAKSSPEVVDACMAKITFTNDDLLLSDTPHNRPLLMIGFAREQKVNRILIDDGSGVNILPIHTMKELGIAMEDLSIIRLMIQGFNQGGPRAIGAVKVDITIGELQSITWLHVIDARTSYNILLGRPWVHENKMIPSTYH
ncbi:uncharacterized protein LOC132601308 [Lycium barbarum]|uniref:uncharacterized protein LOC132601308 n=1 Tax=Lycium barbarum TaxID=112863 RepID=UPI00293E11B6|nr:uncharacterized protein LOC132601308 [Lycium barbarum]